MPVLGLTDQNASFPLLGTIHKGSPKKKAMVKNKRTGQMEEKEIQGNDLEYFRFEVADKKNDLAVEEKWVRKFGAEPTSIPFLLLYDDPDQAFDVWMKEYKANNDLLRKCDGETQCQWLTPKGEYSFRPKPCEKANGGSCQCTLSGELRVVIPELSSLKYIKVLTHSKWDVIDISRQLRMVYQSLGRLVGIPFLLRRSPRKISAPMGEKRGRVTKSLLSVEVHPNAAEKVLDVIEQRAFASLTGVQEQPLLLPETLAIEPETVDVEPVTPVRSYADLQAIREQLGWSKEQVVSFLSDNFGVTLPTQLTDQQYESALEDLRLIASRPIPAEVIADADIPL
jgi:hypothetical protein